MVDNMMASPLRDQILVKSLLKLVAEYVVSNITLLESLVGFPEMLGETLFNELIADFLTNSNRGALVHGLHIFSDAYPSVVLKCLNLSGKLVVINEYTDSLLPMMTSLTELDLSHCHLGMNHEVFQHFYHMNKLNILKLRDCDLNDDVIRRLTLPCKMSGKSFINLETFDISCNIKLTKRSLLFLRCLKKLRFLYLSLTEFMELDEKTLKAVGFIQFSPNDSNSQPNNRPTETMGWASVLVNHFIDKMEQTSKTRSPKSSNFYPNFRARMVEQLKSSPSSLSLPCIHLVRTNQDLKQSRDQVKVSSASLVLSKDVLAGYTSMETSNMQRPNKRRRTLLEELTLRNEIKSD